jgi:amino acid transporter
VSILAIILVVVGIIFAWDPIYNIFYWFGAVAVIAIVLTEILVSIAVIVYFRRTKEDTRIWNTVLAPVISIILLAVGWYMLIARYNLFAGTAVDPAMCPGDAGSGCGPFELNTTGWVLVLLTPAMLIIGIILGSVRQKKENYDAVRNFVS